MAVARHPQAAALPAEAVVAVTKLKSFWAKVGFLSSPPRTGADWQPPSCPDTVELSRLTGRESEARVRRYPEHREVNGDCPPWPLGSGNPCRNDEDKPVSTALPPCPPLKRVSSEASSTASANLSLQALTAAALALPGLMISPAQALELDESGFQASYYDEGKRHTYTVHSNLKPIQVDSLQGGGLIGLTDRSKLAFHFTQDTWGGATPVATAPLAWGGNHPSNTQSGASPLLQLGTVHLDSQLNPLQQNATTGKYTKNTQLVHTLAMASPETRKQGDLNLSYEWDEAALSMGAGLSQENDFQSRFGNLSGRWDFNQKQTSLNLGLSYTNSDINALLDHDATPYIYNTSAGLANYSQIQSGSQINLVGGAQVNNRLLTGNRQDWATNLSMTQILNKNSLVVAGIGFTRNTGYLANPYKAVTTVFVDPTQKITSPSSVLTGTSLSLLEKRPQERDQWTGNLSYVQHIDALDSALHFDYRVFSDDWGITSHTFEFDWVQPVFDTWTVTPMIRYYSQTAADFYTPYVVSFQTYPGKPTYNPKTQAITLSQLNPNKLPANYSSDQRLSAYGAISGGMTVSKQFAKGITLALGAEYYTHAGSLKMGGGGEGSYADFNYYMVNASVKVDFSAITLPSLGHGNHGNQLAQDSQGEHADHSQHDGHGNHGDHSGHNDQIAQNDQSDQIDHSQHGSHAPAGVMFSHLLPQAGDFMVGYRYLYSTDSGQMVKGLNPVSDHAIVSNGCKGSPCYVTPTRMDMNMHMLDLMYAPTDWLTLMAMPQFMDQSMTMRPLNGAPSINNASPSTSAAVMHSYHEHQTGGVGDTGLYALFKLFDVPGHHVHVTLGVSAPTGDTGIQMRDTHGVNIGFIHYGMQLGSGTWDFKPSITYTGQMDEWSWGAQISGTHRLQEQNVNGYSLGDILQTTAWGSYSVFDWLSASVRGLYTTEGAIKFAYNGIYNPVGPMDYTSNYGGHYWDLGFGLNAMIPTGNLQGNHLSVEWLQPIHDDPNGYQLPHVGKLAATWSYSF